MIKIKLVSRNAKPKCFLILLLIAVQRSAQMGIILIIQPESVCQYVQLLLLYSDRMIPILVLRSAWMYLSLDTFRLGCVFTLAQVDFTCKISLETVCLTALTWPMPIVWVGTAYRTVVLNILMTKPIHANQAAHRHTLKTIQHTNAFSTVLSPLRPTFK